MRAFEQQPSPRQRFFIDLAETTPSAPSRPPVYGNAIVAASPPVPWPPPLASTPRGLHGARLRQAHSPRPYSVARHAVATVTGHPRAFASPLPGYTLQSPRRLAPQEVYEMNPRSPRQPVGEQGVPAVPVRRFQQVHVAPPRENGVSLDQGQGMAAPVPAPPLEAPGTLVPGTELQVGYLRLRCEELLGSGSYSTVWLAKVVPQRQSSAKLQENQEEVKSVALKDVFCRGEAALQQSLFEVQLLMAVERRMSRNKAEVSPPRLPRCLTYQVDASEEGWSVRMALTRLKGEQLDGWLQRSCEVNGGHFQRPWTDQLHGGCILARQLLQQLGPTLQNLARFVGVDMCSVSIEHVAGENAPLVFYSGFTRSFLAGEQGTSAEWLQKIQQKVAAMSEGRRVLIIDGVGFPSVGSIVGVDNADVAKAAKAPVLLVCASTAGSAVDSFSLNASYFVAKGVPVLGALFNLGDADGFYSWDKCAKSIEAWFSQHLGSLSCLCYPMFLLLFFLSMTDCQ
ncbi:unnamed protein product [Durusdinium trenchii]|uniref:Non-specific serine/threonine protein kinase n=1 Tax=Durusdinium trenchii TaxID=1381693 RepID=A0ABP0HA41_9DINO